MHLNGQAGWILDWNASSTVTPGLVGPGPGPVLDSSMSSSLSSISSSSSGLRIHVGGRACAATASGTFQESRTATRGLRAVPMWIACVGPPRIDGVGPGSADVDAVLPWSWYRSVPADAPAMGFSEANGAHTNLVLARSPTKLTCPGCVATPHRLQHPEHARPSVPLSRPVSFMAHSFCSGTSLTGPQVSECYELASAASTAAAAAERCESNSLEFALFGSGAGIFEYSSGVDLLCSHSGPDCALWLPIVRAPGGTARDWFWVRSSPGGALTSPKPIPVPIAAALQRFAPGEPWMFPLSSNGPA